jgi:hypothetical protein
MSLVDLAQECTRKSVTLPGVLGRSPLPKNGKLKKINTSKTYA